MGLLLLGLIAGAGIGAIAMAFLAVAAYDRGYADASRGRAEWRRERAARRTAQHGVQNAA
jgi:hypothetical protein